MSHKRTSKTLLSTTELDTTCSLNGDKITTGASVTPGSGIALDSKALPIKRATLTLSAEAVNIASANDYGSVKLVDLPVKFLLIKAVDLDLDVTVSGFATDQASTLDMAVGTVALSSTDFSNTGEQDLVDEYGAVGAMATGTANGHSFSNANPADFYIADGATYDIYLNVQGAVTSGTGIATFTGTVDIFYIDLEA